MTTAQMEKIERIEETIANNKMWREYYQNNNDLVAVGKYNRSIAEMEAELKNLKEER